MSEIVLARISKNFGAVKALSEVDLTVAQGEFVVLLGPTGAGKTTLLRIIAGLEKPTQGSVSIGGRDATGEAPAERDVSFVFQRYSLYPHLTVFENLAFPLKAPMRRMPRAAIQKLVEETAAMLRIGHKLNTPVTRLSGGEMQRVAIGRALVRRPAVYLMDEPLSSLDAQLRAELRLELKHIQQDLGATILYVTHDQTEAMTLSNRIGILEEGRLVQLGTAREIYENPVNAYVAARLGAPRINLLPADRLRGADVPSGVRTVGARTEHVQIVPEREGPAAVTMVEHLGNESHVHLEFNGQEIVTLVEPDARLAPGDRVAITLEDALYFDAMGRNMALLGMQPKGRSLVLR